MSQILFSSFEGNSAQRFGKRTQFTFTRTRSHAVMRSSQQGNSCGKVMYGTTHAKIDRSDHVRQMVPMRLAGVPQGCWKLGQPKCGYPLKPLRNKNSVTGKEVSRSVQQLRDLLFRFNLRQRGYQEVMRAFGPHAPC